MEPSANVLNVSAVPGPSSCEQGEFVAHAECGCAHIAQGSCVQACSNAAGSTNALQAANAICEVQTAGFTFDPGPCTGHAVREELCTPYTSCNNPNINCMAVFINRQVPNECCRDVLISTSNLPTCPHKVHDTRCTQGSWPLFALNSMVPQAFLTPVSFSNQIRSHSTTLYLLV